MGGAPNFPMFPGGLPNIFAQGPLATFANAARGGDPSRERGGGEPDHLDKDPREPSNNAVADIHHGSPQQKRKKVESGSGGSSSSKDGGNAALAAALRCREDLQEAAAEAERREHERLFKGLRDADELGGKGETSLLPLPPGMSGKDIAGYVPNQRLEWKRYKQYTRNDIMAAIEEVKKGKSSSVITLPGGPGPFLFLEPQTKVRFQQTLNQGCC